MLSTIESAVVFGVEGEPSAGQSLACPNGLPGFTVVGLPDTACRESRDRVRSALLLSSLPCAAEERRSTSSPSGVRKQGAGLDLAIAVGVLAANGDL